MTSTLRAFHNDPAIQAQYLARVRAHAAADAIVQGRYWKHGKGCAVGCTIHGDDHSRYEAELGIPATLAHLEDAMFEAMPNARAKRWPEEFLAAIPLGADLSGVWPAFAAWMMDDPTSGVVARTKDPEIRDLAMEVALRYRAGDTTGPEADDLANRLWDAWDAWAARAAWTAWAARAAWTAWAARDAWDVGDAWDARDARDARFAEAGAQHLLALLASAPVPPSDTTGESNG